MIKGGWKKPLRALSNGCLVDIKLRKVPGIVIARVIQIGLKETKRHGASDKYVMLRRYIPLERRWARTPFIVRRSRILRVHQRYPLD